ncbi:Tetratricopeptide repeat family protein [Borrelia coriaceae ATCC 43381]|uniref:Tetratricopeptide repeat family protein n=1 Tax=Borrelia coriaceae ATCC 43381 TaxID=1408429 RepID=W5ST60_9SPIR|nr:Tetratricopeptide repeat family protein [Borrelia coriaceae ATCC 43381]
MLDKKLLGDFGDISQISNDELLDVTEKSKKGISVDKGRETY